MDQILLVAVLSLAALSLLNLVLLLGVVRRIREHEARFTTLAFGPPEVIAPVGHRVGDFTAVSVDGRPVASAALDGPTLVGFLSPGCDACHERLDDFQRAVAGHPGTALAVVVRDGGDTDSLVAGLAAGGATVVVEDVAGPLAAAFGVSGFPAFAILDADGTIRARGYELPLVAAP